MAVELGSGQIAPRRRQRRRFRPARPVEGIHVRPRPHIQSAHRVDLPVHHRGTHVGARLRHSGHLGPLRPVEPEHVRHPVGGAADGIEGSIQRLHRHPLQRHRQSGHLGPVRPVEGIHVRLHSRSGRRAAAAAHRIDLPVQRRRAQPGARRRQTHRRRPARAVERVDVRIGPHRRLPADGVERAVQYRERHVAPDRRKLSQILPIRPVIGAEVRQNPSRLPTPHVDLAIQHGGIHGPQRRRHPLHLAPARPVVLDLAVDDPSRRIVGVGARQQDIAFVRRLHHDVHRARIGRGGQHDGEDAPARFHERCRHPIHQHVRDVPEVSVRDGDLIAAPEGPCIRRNTVARTVQPHQVGRRRRVVADRQPIIVRAHAGRREFDGEIARATHRHRGRKSGDLESGIDLLKSRNRQRFRAVVRNAERVRPRGAGQQRTELRAVRRLSRIATRHRRPVRPQHPQPRRVVREGVCFHGLAETRRIDPHIAEASADGDARRHHHLGRRLTDDARGSPAQRHVRDVRAIA